MTQTTFSSSYVGDLKTIRSSVSTDDLSTPSLGTGQSFTGFKYVNVEITLGGTSPTWNITPLIAKLDGTGYKPGITRVISTDEPLSLQVDSSSDVNFRVDGSTGTSPTITIKGAGVNS